MCVNVSICLGANRHQTACVSVCLCVCDATGGRDTPNDICLLCCFGPGVFGKGGLGLNGRGYVCLLFISVWDFFQLPSLVCVHECTTCSSPLSSMENIRKVYMHVYLNVGSLVHKGVHKRMAEIENTYSIHNTTRICLVCACA